ncbi:serine protease [Clavibacter michiganensis subsp. insidiosus]|uniref:Serine protease n=1 Tax=Clavibacter michiganensis subsp. insidiosus TaxID=33014 RepID=A0A399N4Q9_9MICO|nr:S8 family serine peptidase [Clavibacter michiganensis]AWG02462.1 serine protease [Clavibacter michiganensis subsp. insidiosus]OQJ59095.1 serine protease [Clavibacter michiganensis subsp. insidiosus]RII88169.1 serine protease [Clavibacter michiganensis subsp. insidiosus]RIJ44871.1 serine protease [Clavibacter michiganensis subsp. insidiosus]RMC84623.1 serine protease [Clavibacter michiganensis subsp. insidiosus]
MPIHRDPQPPGRRPRLRAARPFAVGAIAFALVAAGTTTATADEAPTASVPFGAKDGTYLVTLRDQPAAAYDGTLDGLAPTRVEPGARLDAQSDAVQRYSDHLTQLQDSAADAAGVTPTNRYSLTVNGFSAKLTAAQVQALSQDRDVLSVEPDQTLHPTSTPDSRFIGLEGDNGLWSKVGGVDKAGQGTVVGIIDTGIAPDSPSFAGKPLGSTPGADPYRDGSRIDFRKGDGTVFHGTCQAGDGFTASDCSTKIVGARAFEAGRAATDRPLGPQEKVSPLDTDGHGSHTGSTAAGDAGVTATAGTVQETIAGIAPAAKVAAYKVCWDGPDPTKETDDGCELSDIVAGIEQATADGVDVINMSLGGAGKAADAFQRALLGAADAGIFVAAAAGNSGPNAGTVSNTEPWITTVAASSVPRNYSGTVTLGSGAAFVGASMTVGSPVSGPLVRAADSGVKGATSPELCGAGTLDPDKVRGRIVQCDRGIVNRIDKSAEVKRAGGIGMVLTNVKSDSQDLDLHTVPTVHVDADARQAIVDYAAKPGATATLTNGNTTGVERPAPQVAGFSSRGASEEVDGGDTIKPDITAPGVGILAAVSDKGGKPAFAPESGTSMSSPHIAGFGLVYLGVHPKASPAEVKSALMTTATDTLGADGKPATDPFAQGAGQIAPDRFLEPGLFYPSGAKDWAGYAAATGLALPDPVAPVAPSQLNLPSIGVGKLMGSTTVTRTVTSLAAGTWTASVQGVSQADVKVTPARLTFTAPGQTKSFQVRITAKRGAPSDAWSTGSLTWTGSAGTVRSPIAVRPTAVTAPATVDGTGTSGKADVTVDAGVTGRIPLTTAGLTRGKLVSDGKTDHTGSVSTTAGEEFKITVKAGQKALVFDATPLDGASDLAMQLEKVGKTDRDRTRVSLQDTPSLSERIVVPAPAPGDYFVAVQAAKLAGSATSVDYDLTRYDVQGTGGEGSFAVSPAQLPVTAGKKATYTASWSGLAAGTSYVGLVSYGGSAATTLVGVTTPPASAAPTATTAPAITGTPDVGQTLTASTGTWTPAGVTLATQWLSNGTPIAGATGSTFRVTSAVAGTALAVQVTATASDGQKGVATSPTISARDAATVHLQATQPQGAASGTLHVQVSVTSAAKQAATGVVRVTVDGAEHDVPLDGSGTGCADLTGVAPGTHTVQASYVGDNLVGGAASRAQRIRVR